MLTCFYNPKITVKSRRASDSTSTIISPADIKMGPLGWTAEIDLTDADLSASSNAAEVMFPFKIYSIGDSLTLQIRSGLIGFRSNYLIPGETINSTTYYYQGNYELSLTGTGTDNAGFDEDRAPYEGNFPARTSIQAPPEDYFYAAPTANSGGSFNLVADGSAQLICSNELGSANPPGIQIKLPSDMPDDSYVSFWIEMVDDSTLGPYTKLWGSINRAIAFGNNTLGNPSDKQTMAIGWAYYANAASSPQIFQLQSGHLVNRYLEKMPQTKMNGGNIPKFAGVAQIQRGWWTFNSLSGKVFYPGDVIVDDTHNFASAAIGSYFKTYTYNQNIMGIESSPPFANSHFTLYGILPR